MPDLNIRETHVVRDERSESNAMTILAVMFGVMIIGAFIGYFAWWQPNHTTTIVQNPNPIVIEKPSQPTYIPVPMAGAPGPAGPAGASGSSGASGEEGATGRTGQTGQTGAAGQSGPSGQPGSSGPSGPSGSPGSPGR